MSWKTLRVDLPGGGANWAVAQIGTISVWGSGNNGQDLWGWPDAGAMHTGNIVEHADGTAHFDVFLDQPSNSTVFAVVMRLIFNEPEPTGIVNTVFCKEIFQG